MQRDQDPQDDPAEAAFIEMRNAFAGLTRAVNSLSGEWKGLEVPDYSTTLQQIAVHMQAHGEWLERVNTLPAMRLTPQTLATDVVKAAASARHEEQRSLKSAERTFVDLAREMTGFLESARTADRQNKWVAAMFALGATLGCVLALVFTR